MKFCPDFRLIIAADDDSYHLDYLPICSAGWRRFFPECSVSLVVVGDRPREEYDAFCDPWVDTLHVVPDVPNSYSANLAKIARLWLAGQFGDDFVTINDIDLVPLQRDFYAGKLAQWPGGDTVLAMGAEVYASNAAEAGKVPMSALSAKSHVLRDVANSGAFTCAQMYEFYRELLPDGAGDIRASTSQGNFSDESLCRDLLKRWGGEIHHIARGYNLWTETLDRAAWRPDRVKLFSGGYLEAHMHKVNTQWERDRCNIIAEYLDVSDDWQNGKHWTDITGRWADIEVGAHR